MAKIIQLCAVAVFLIVAIPIAVGFALPGEESTRSYWDEDESYVITDSLVNDTEDYYVMSSSVSNNRWLISSDGQIVTPGYVSLTSVRTSLENVIWGDSTELDESEMGDGSFVEDPITYSSDMGEVRVITGVGTIAPSSGSVIESTEDDSLTVICYPISSGVVVWYRTSDLTLSGWSSLTAESVTLTPFSYYLWPRTMEPSVTTTAAFMLESPAYIGSMYAYLVVTEGTTQEVVPLSPSGSSVTKVGSLLYVDGSVVSSAVSSVSVVAYSTYNTAEYPAISLGTVSGYVDYYSGWTVPEASGLSWDPGHLTESASIDIQIADGQSITLQPEGVSSATISKYDGVVYVSTSPDSQAALGAYSWIRVTVSSDGLYVYEGLSGAPSSGSAASLVSMSYESEGSGDLFDKIALSWTGSSPVLYVESASIYAGTYSVSKDAVIDMAALYPGWTDWKVQIAAGASVQDGAYIEVGGQVYQVDASASTVTLGGDVVSLGNLAILRVDGELYIGGIDLGPTSASTVTLGGQWVAAVTASSMSEHSEETLEWVAGSFSLSSSGMAAVGIAMCALAFVGLSLVGGRSAMKTLALAGVCGFAAYIWYLVM